MPMTVDDAVAWVDANRNLVVETLRRKGRDLRDLNDYLQDAYVAALCAVKDQNKPRWRFESFFFQNFQSILTKNSADPVIVERRRMMAGATKRKRDAERELERQGKASERFSLVQYREEDVNAGINPFVTPFTTLVEFLQDPPIDLDRTARKLEPLLLPAQRPVFRALLGIQVDGCLSLGEAGKLLGMKKEAVTIRYGYAMKRIRKLVATGKLKVEDLPRLRMVCLPSPCSAQTNSQSAPTKIPIHLRQEFQTRTVHVGAAAAR